MWKNIIFNLSFLERKKKVLEIKIKQKNNLMNNSDEKPSNYKQKSKIWHWIAILGVLLSLISGSLLLYQWWQNKQNTLKIQQKEQELNQAQQEQEKIFHQYQEQKNWVNLTNPLANNPKIKQLFHNLLQIFADRYAKSKKIDNSHLPLYFGGFYQKPFLNGEKQGEMGHCELNEDNQLAIIRLNQLYLLNKLGHESYLASPESFLVIDLDTLTETMAHELSYYIQYVKHKKSSCESSGAKRY